MSLSTAEPGRLLNTAEAARYLRVSRRKLEHWVASGFVPVVRLDRTIRRFDRQALDELIDEGTRTRPDGR